MKKIQTKIMILVVLATLGVSLVNVLLGTVITRNSTVTALEKTVGETAKLAALSAENPQVFQSYLLHLLE